ITPFLENNRIDFNALQQVTENQVKGGMDYLVALGTTAETPTLTGQEKLEAVQAIKEKAGGLPVVVGMGGNDTRKIIKQIGQFNFTGVSGLLIVTPYYNKPTQKGIFHHYSAIAKECPVPIILYNVPSRTGVNMNADTVIRLAEKYDNIAAVKEASGEISQITEIGKYTPDGFSIISGDDVLALPILSVGGSGVISVIANALPEKLSGLIHAGLEGRFDDAKNLHYELIDLLNLIFKEGNPGGIKALMHIQGSVQNILRSPLYRVSDETYAEIEAAYRKLK
ncbi:MAG: 4-hydroxy-tetrahydrodipicolinate synthase, partial [Prolixibacteraceae bacterium]